MMFPAYEDEASVNSDEHYFLQDIYFARKIIENKSKNHCDIGNRIDGFIVHLLSANVEVTILDIRPFSVDVEGLKFIQTDATTLKGVEDESMENMSSLHAIEYLGLGRYGDAIDSNSWKKSLLSI